MPEQAPARLTRLREKLCRLAELPVDVALLLRFDQRLAAMSAEAFIDEILIEALRVKHLVVGDDFRFGRARSGNFGLLQSQGRVAGYTVADTHSIEVAGTRVSSTSIRQALLDGDMVRACELLGRPYSICGRVVAGERLGRQIGFPTANLRMWRKNTPLQGVFAVTMGGVADRPLPGVANVGTKPTVDGGRAVQLETHLIDFAGDVYGRRVEVHFHRKLRDERRFENVQALTEQIGRDVAAAREFFQSGDPIILSV